jgi:transposase InsO family protein
MIDEHSDYALALAVPSLNSDITSHFANRVQSNSLSLSDKLSLTTVRSSSVTLMGATGASIKRIWTYPYTPKMNATCERFNRT